MSRLTKENVERARALVALYPHPRSALLPLLHLAQEQDGYLTRDGMEHVAELLDLTPAEVYGIASFYDMFFFEPIGRYLVSICTNVACMLNGAYELLEHAEERLETAPGGTTADGAFTLEEVECVALCGNAPCLTVNWRFFGDVTKERFDEIVAGLRDGSLASQVPPHGTLSRVGRTVGLVAGPPGDAQPPAGGAAPRTELASSPTAAGRRPNEKGGAKTR